ncbi:hypothetical protein X798_07416, partial [Onchocerca flexuosa]
MSLCDTYQVHKIQPPWLQEGFLQPNFVRANYGEMDPSQWPDAKAITHNYEEDKIQFIEAHRFSKWTKIVRVTVWILRFIKRT